MVPSPSHSIGSSDLAPHREEALGFLNWLHGYAGPRPHTMFMSPDRWNWTSSSSEAHDLFLEFYPALANPNIRGRYEDRVRIPLVRLGTRSCQDGPRTHAYKH